MSHSLRAELQNDFQSRVDQLQNDFQSQIDQLKEKITQLEGEASRLEKENSQLKSKIGQLEEKVKSLEHSVNKAERKSKYLEIVKKNEQWEYPLSVPTMGKLMSDGYDEELSEEIISQIDYIKDVTTKMRKGESINYISIDFYYEGMLPHYRQFENALVEYQHTIDYM
eukprot:scaffold52200_cov37-Cyclotella_meneghiniana.AAC.1